MGEEKSTNGCGEEENGCGEENKWVRRREQMGEEKSTIVLWGHCSYWPVLGATPPSTDETTEMPTTTTLPY